MNRLKNYSIRRKLILIILSISVVGVVVSLTIYSVIDIVKFKKQINDNATINAELVSNYCVAPLMFDYKEEVTDILKKLEALPNVLNACVYNEEGDLFATYSSLNNEEFEFPKASIEESQMVNQTLQLFKPIVFQNKNYGTFYLRVSTKELQNKIATSIFIIILLLVLLGIPVFFLASKYQGIISEPILQLASITKDISKSQNFSSLKKINRSDEIGVLYSNFSDLMQELNLKQKQRDKAELKLKKLNEELETRVKERTNELEDTNEKLIRSKDKAEAANKSKSIFLSNMSHELRTPMNAILGFSELLLRDEDLNKEQYKKLKTINKSGEHLLALINDVLQISKIEAGHVQINEANFDIDKLLDEIGLMFHLITQKKNIDFKLVNLGLPQYIISDEGKIRQILINLIGNAVKFTENGQVKIETGILKTDGEFIDIFINVQDTGVGIEEEDLDKVFDYFEQVGSSKKSSEGSGIGLAICKKFTKLLLGDISVVSEFGKGSTFRAVLKVKKGKKENIIIEYPKNRVLGLADKNLDFKVLVTDDRKTNRDLLTSLLELIGCNVKEAKDGREAVQLYEDWKPQLILMDMIMPVMDGFEATKIISKMANESDVKIKIIAVTASVLEEELDSISVAGAADIIRKPFREAELFEKIKKHCNIKFVYEQAENKIVNVKNVESNIGEKVEIKDSKIPNEIINELLLATENGDKKRMLKHIKDIKMYNDLIAKKLLALTNTFQYEEVLNIISAIKS